MDLTASFLSRVIKNLEDKRAFNLRHLMKNVQRPFRNRKITAEENGTCVCFKSVEIKYCYNIEIAKQKLFLQLELTALTYL